MEEANSRQSYEFLADDPNFNVKPVIISLIIGAFFAILNETLLNIAFTTLMEQFSISESTVQWMATGFMLIMGIMTPISALFIQSFTTRQMFLGTMIIFTVGTVICAIAPAYSTLLAGRLLQAVGTGLLIPVIFHTFLLVFPPRRRGTVMGTVGLVIMFAPAIGPTLSGIIVEYLGWRYLFLTVVPFTLFSIVFAFIFLKNVGEVTKPKLDLLSVLLSTTGFGGIVLGFSLTGEGNSGFSAPVVWSLIGLGMVSLVLFTLRQIQLPEPLLDLRVFRYPMFTLALIQFMIIMMLMFSSEIILPMYLQGSLDVQAATAGLILLPGALLNGFMSPVMGRLFDKYGPRMLMIPATFVLTVTMFALSRIGLTTPLWYIMICYLLLMLSVSAVMMPAQTNGLNELPKRLYPHGTAMMNTLQPVSGAIGVSVFIGMMTSKKNAYLENVQNPQDPDAVRQALVSGVEFVYLVVFAIAVIAFILSLFVKRAMPKDVTSDAIGNEGT